MKGVRYEPVLLMREIDRCIKNHNMPNGVRGEVVTG